MVQQEDAHRPEVSLEHRRNGVEPALFLVLVEVFEGRGTLQVFVPDDIFALRPSNSMAGREQSKSETRRTTRTNCDLGQNIWFDLPAQRGTTDAEQRREFLR